MKTLIFTLSVLALMGTGTYIKLGDELQFTDGIFSDDSIADYGEWNSILPGKWKFKTVYKTPKWSTVFDGEAEYNADGSFNRLVNVKYYHDPNAAVTAIKEANVRIIAGGGLNGKWTMGENGLWNEVVKNCNMSSPYIEQGYNAQYNACEWFPLKDTLTYGNNVSITARFEVKAFNKERIVIKGRDFTEDAQITYTFYRMAN